MHKPSPRPVLVAAIGSLLLAFPGSYGFLLLASLMFTAGLPEQPQHMAAWLMISIVVLGLPLLGFYLLAGYWRAVRSGVPSKHPRRFWYLSATYNALGLVLACVAVFFELWEGNSGVPLFFSVLHVGWTAFMTWLGVWLGRAAVAAPHR